MCQTASIEFLAKYQFDFNTCFRDGTYLLSATTLLYSGRMMICIELLHLLKLSGISYLSRGQEEEARKRLASLYEDDDRLASLKENKDIPVVRMADVLFTERIKCKINEWVTRLQRVTSGEREIQNSSNDSFETIFFKMRPAIKLNGFTSRQLRLIQLVMFSVKFCFNCNIFIPLSSDEISIVCDCLSGSMSG